MLNTQRRIRIALILSEVDKMSNSELIANSDMEFGGNQFLLNPNRQKAIIVLEEE